MAPQTQTQVQARRLFRALEEFTKIDSEFPLQFVQAFLLICEEDGVSMKDMATRLDMSQSSLSRAVAALSKWRWLKRPGYELVEQFIDPMDTRRKHVRLTAKGHQLCKKIREVLQ